MIVASIDRGCPMAGAEAKSPESAHPAPLDGLRVVDFSRMLSGPLSTMILGDLGAYVIRIKDLEGTDTTRPPASEVPPPAHPDADALPLEGLRVLDLTRMLAGPYGTLILADPGAVRAVGTLFRCNGPLWRTRPPPPALGEHNAEVLGSLTQSM